MCVDVLENGGGRGVYSKRDNYHIMINNFGSFWVYSIQKVGSLGINYTRRWSVREIIGRREIEN